MRILKDFNNLELNEARPGTPVKILGFKKICQVGDILQVIVDKKEFKRKKKNILYFLKRKEGNFYFLWGKKIFQKIKI